MTWWETAYGLVATTPARYPFGDGANPFADEAVVSAAVIGTYRAGGCAVAGSTFLVSGFDSAGMLAGYLVVPDGCGLRSEHGEIAWSDFTEARVVPLRGVSFADAVDACRLDTPAFQRFLDEHTTKEG